jgi:hypothetical protein
MNQRNRWAPSLLVSACLWACVAPAALAASVNLPVGLQANLNDPAGSGRTLSALFSGGTSTIAFSRGADFDWDAPASSMGGALAVLNAGQITLRQSGPVLLTEQAVTDSTDGTLVRISASIGSPAASVSVDQDTSAISTIALAGAFGFDAPNASERATGGSVTMSNVRFDLAKKQIVADLDGTRSPVSGTSWQPFSQSDTVMWTFDAITGAEALPADALFGPNPAAALTQAGYAVKETLVTSTEVVGYTQGGYYDCSPYGYSYGYGGGGCSYAPPQPIFGQSLAYEITGTTLLTGLTLTPQGIDFLRQSLGLRPVMIDAFKGIGDFGSVALTTSFTVAVPEPQTYALMALGLVMMTGVVRRHRRAAA